MGGKLYKSQNDRVLAGVCGGIGEYFNIDSTIIRLLWIAGTFAYGIGILVYIIAAIVIPDRGGEYKSYEGTNDVSNIKSEKAIGYILVGLGVLLLLRKFNIFYWVDTKVLFPVLLIITGIVMLKDSFKK